MGNKIIYRFKNGLLEIDASVEDLMVSAFSTIGNVEEGLEIMQSLVKCSQRVRLSPLFEKFTMHVSFIWFHLCNVL